MIREEMGKDAYNKVKVRLVLEAIAAEEKMEISDEEVEQRTGNMLPTTVPTCQLEQVKQLISKDAIAYDLRIRKALELLKETAGK